MSFTLALSADTLPAPGSEEAWKAGIDFDGATPEEVADASGKGASLGGGAVRGPLIVPAGLVLSDGDSPPGTNGPVTSLNSPFTNGNGQVGFTGGADGASGTDNFVWFDTGIAFLDADEMSATLSGGESTMGVSNSGGFIYSPSVDGDDAVWTSNGLLQVENTQAPGFPPGVINTFNSRPQMIPTGRSYWVSGFNATGGTSTEGRILYTSSDSTPGNIAVVLASDDMIGGFAIDRPSGIGFDYAFSDDGSHHIHDLLMDTGSTVNDGFIYVDGVLVAREGSANGDGDDWDNFDVVSINNSGNYIFSGDSDGATSSDEFIAYNGSIAMREGDVVAGQPLTSSATVAAASINNLGHAAYIWNISGGAELMFISCDASDLVGSAQIVLATEDLVDLDGNGTGDATVTDFNASNIIGPGLWLAEDGFIFVEVDLLDLAVIEGGEGEYEATLQLENPCGGADDAPARATFEVSKVFDDGNPAEVEVTLSCNTGLPLTQMAMISEGDPVNFVVVDFADGEMDCSVSEGLIDGYTSSYINTDTQASGCDFENVAYGSAQHCRIENSLDAVEFAVTKVWMDENPNLSNSMTASADYRCFGAQFSNPAGSLEFFGDGDVATFGVFPHWNGNTTCSVIETLVDTGVEFNDSDCLDVSVTVGNDASCTIYNTRLYEGIPTLSRYGLAILVMFMLGLGLVAFRRFA